MKKKFGQNFLTDKNLLKKIVDKACINDKDVIEIGPGLGALTQFLVLEANSVTAYEVDQDLKYSLSKMELEHKNLKVIFADILTVDIDREKEYHVVANIPYNITSPILFKILNQENIKSATLMVQKEVEDRIAASPNSKNYNALSVIVKYYMDIERIANVSRKMFNPAPKVDSAVFRMIRKERIFLDKEEKLFIEIVKASFQQKRKTLVNNLFQYSKVSKSIIVEYLKGLNIEENKRAENLELEDFIEITQKWDAILRNS
ncbi:MAG: 16S rRNA (adenine(1518)-N(6)/adenine(1519)-N(6))-dimethyltransferase RsmA [Acholeplasma sp.]|nr:16S rRNA (adenine(1518)-N(6)/adenine(1519)-N(6))-dimethyltransferase RsmA [Acholeplasma sp.]